MKSRVTSPAKHLSALLGVDKKSCPRAIFLYDGGCGVCKYTVGFVLERDSTDHMRFSPLQSAYAQNLCDEYGMPADLSTGILLDETGAHRDSTAILRILPHLGFFWAFIGYLAIYLVPKVVRDMAYQAFARNRGTIWKQVKRTTGLGDTMMDDYRDKILGLDDNVHEKEPGWGFTAKRSPETKKEK